MDDARVQGLNDAAPDENGRYVLYWMQQSQRARFNHALEHALRRANERDEPLLVVFGVTDEYPDANARHYLFMLQGLAEVARDLADRGIRFVMRQGEPDEVALELAQQATLVVCDRGYLRHQRRWREHVAADAGRRVEQVESDVVVPVEIASDKREFAARTIRPKIGGVVEQFLGGLSASTVARPSLQLELPAGEDIDPADPEHALDALSIDRDVAPVQRFRGGTSQARERLARFLRGAFRGYADARNDPSDPQCSQLSPYLHFGQISPVEVARKVRAAKGGSDEDREGFLEELIVRRELAVNYVYYEPDYDSYGALPEWARKTLAEHRDDARPARYTRAELEAARTDDPYWNAAMCEMLRTGYMHNYMRMYWGKKIIEWCNTPEYAYATALYLNNRYFLDGRDPSSYANVAWLFGLHDRPWTERQVFGKVRYMNAAGLERKFDIDAYVEWVSSLPA